MAAFQGAGGGFGGGGASAAWAPVSATSSAKGPLVIGQEECSGVSVGSQVLDILGTCCTGNPHLNYSGVNIKQEEGTYSKKETPTPGCEGMLPDSSLKNDPCRGIYFIGATRTYNFVASDFGVSEPCEESASASEGLPSTHAGTAPPVGGGSFVGGGGKFGGGGASGSWKEDKVGGGGGAGGFPKSVGGGGQSGGGGATGRWDAAKGAADVGNNNSKICRKWHWQNPDYAELSDYTNCDPPLFGFLGRSGSTNKNSAFSFGLPCKVDQLCLGLYARYNLVGNYFAYVKPDQIRLGRYVRKIQRYYHEHSSHLISENTGQRVKWRAMSFIQWLASAFSLAFFLTGCGRPCYRCSFDDHRCPGHGEHALNSVIAAHDSFWLVDRAGQGMLWPNKRFLLEYYGTIVRGPEPWMGWFYYIMFKEWTCDYCGCILFCFFVDCIGPWFIRYQVVSSVLTFNQNDSIPQALPGKFIEFVEKVNAALKKEGEQSATSQANKTAFETIGKLPIDYDHFTVDHVFIEGKADYHTADLFIEGPNIKARPLSSYLNCDCPADDTVAPVTLGADFQYATRTDCCGFYKGEGATSIAENVTETNNKQNEPLRHATFVGFRTPGSQDDLGYPIRNQAIKYHTHKTRPDIWRYNWLYVDIPDPVPIECTPVQLAFDSFINMPEGYFDDNDPLTIMRKRVYFKSVLTNGAIELHAGVKTPRPGGPRVTEVLTAFSENKMTDADLFYPFVWSDRVITKSVKAPYNIYFKSGESSFRTCKLNELLPDLEAGRYYFPNPYACQASPRMAPYHRSIHGGVKDVNYKVEDEENFSKYFSTYLPMQFEGWDGRYKNDLEGKLKEAKELLGNPELGSFAKLVAFEESGMFDKYTSGPIEEFPVLGLAKVNDMEIVDYLKYSGFNTQQQAMRENQIAEITKDFKNYDSKWWPAFMRK